MINTKFEYTEDGNVGKIALSCDKKFNIINEDFVYSFDRWLQEINKKDHPQVLIITGKKTSFATGLDINIFKDKEINEVRKFVIASNDHIDRFESSEKLFIAAVDGYCLGGGLEMAMAMDYIIASSRAVFGLPEIKIGLLPGAGGIKRLVRDVGKRKAMELFLTGKTITAKEALEIGLINEVVPSWKLMTRAESLAQEIASKNPAAIKATKRLVNNALERDITKDEIKAFIDCLKTPYAKNAINAFLNKDKK